MNMVEIKLPGTIPGAKWYPVPSSGDTRTGGVLTLSACVALKLVEGLPEAAELPSKFSSDIVKSI